MAIHVGQKGIRILLTIKERNEHDVLVPMDLSAATTMEIRLLRPDASKLSVDAEHVTNGVDGQMFYTTAATTDLNSAGIYKAQAYIVKPDFEGPVGDEGEFEFEVKANFAI